jgi:hypothetical protein
VTIASNTKITIIISYSDADDDGYVDGIIKPKMCETSLEIYRLVGTGANAIWTRVPNSKVDTQNNTVSVEISDFSFFILLADITDKK